MQVVHNFNFKKLVISCSISLGVGLLSSLISMPGFMDYPEVKQPPLSPPSFLFPIVWTILFTLMGVSSYLIYNSKTENKEAKKSALTTYIVQLIVNFFWPIIFFNLAQYLIAFIWILLLLFLIAMMIYQFYGINKTAALLNIPYLLWVAFATYLNFGVFLLN